MTRRANRLEKFFLRRDEIFQRDEWQMYRLDAQSFGNLREVVNNQLDLSLVANCFDTRRQSCVFFDRQIFFAQDNRSRLAGGNQFNSSQEIASAKSPIRHANHIRLKHKDNR